MLALDDMLFPYISSLYLHYRLLRILSDPNNAYFWISSTDVTTSATLTLSFNLTSGNDSYTPTTYHQNHFCPYWYFELLS